MRREYGICQALPWQHFHQPICGWISVIHFHSFCHTLSSSLQLCKCPAPKLGKHVFLSRTTLPVRNTLCSLRSPVVTTLGQPNTRAICLIRMRPPAGASLPSFPAPLATRPSSLRVQGSIFGRRLVREAPPDPPAAICRRRTAPPLPASSAPALLLPCSTSLRGCAGTMLRMGVKAARLMTVLDNPVVCLHGHRHGRKAPARWVLPSVSL